MQECFCPSLKWCYTCSRQTYVESALAVLCTPPFAKDVGRPAPDAKREESAAVDEDEGLSHWQDLFGAGDSDSDCSVVQDAQLPNHLTSEFCAKFSSCTNQRIVNY